MLLGYEEALGYSVGTVVRDKDGISAAVHVAELAARCKAAGRTLEDELERLARQVGLYASRQVTLTRPGAAGAREIEDAMTGLRGALPGRLAGLEVVAVADYARGLRWRAEGGDPERLALPAQNMLAFALEGGSRVMVRPSGTEPKLKVYIDVTVPVAESLDAAREDANVLGARLAAEMLALLGG